MKVLVVDDSRLCRSLYRKELVGGGYEVAEAKDGFEALNIVKELPIDLVVLDIEMPNLDGYEVCERLRSSEFDTHFGTKDRILPVIFVTGKDAVESRVKGFSKGANGFIAKGFKPGTLLAHVNEILKPKNFLKGKRALLVDDSRTLRNLITGYLREVEMEVIAVEDGMRAFELLLADTDAYDIVVTSLEIPGMRGDRLCKNIRAELGRKSLPVLILTESMDRRLLMGLFESGATDFLVKPFEKEELIGRIKVSMEMVDALKQEVERRVSQASERAGTADEDAKKAIDRAQLATTVLHNIGNVLNSVFASCFQLSRMLKESRLRQLLLAHKLIEDNQQDLARFFTQDARGKLLPEYLLRSGLRLEEEQLNMVREVEEIATKINLMKDIIEAQQLHAKQSAFELMCLSDIVNDALRVQKEHLERNEVQVDRKFSSEQAVKVKRVPLTHVLINLIKNAVEAMGNSAERKLEISVFEAGGQVQLAVKDSGCGIDPEHLNNLFTHGFTTKVDGHGFGLAFCARAMAEMEGELSVHSEGVGSGASFILHFPILKSDGSAIEVVV